MGENGKASYDKEEIEIPINICHLNIRGLLSADKPKILQLERMLHNNDIHVCCINEANVLEENKKHIIVRNYKCAAFIPIKYPKEKRSVLILVKEDIKFKTMRLGIDRDEIDTDHTKMVGIIIENLCILSAYRVASIQPLDISNFKLTLKTHFLKQMKTYNTIVAADFNLSDEDQKQLIKEIKEGHQKNDKIKRVFKENVHKVKTRYSIDKNDKLAVTCLDNFIVGNCSYKNEDIKDLIMSDHRSLFITVYCTKNCFKSKTEVYAEKLEATGIMELKTLNDFLIEINNPRWNSDVIAKEGVFYKIFKKHVNQVIDNKYCTNNMMKEYNQLLLQIRDDEYRHALTLEYNSEQLKRLNEKITTKAIFFHGNGQRERYTKANSLTPKHSNSKQNKAPMEILSDIISKYFTELSDDTIKVFFTEKNTNKLAYLMETQYKNGCLNIWDIEANFVKDDIHESFKNCLIYLYKEFVKHFKSKGEVEAKGVAAAETEIEANTKAADEVEAKGVDAAETKGIDAAEAEIEAETAVTDEVEAETAAEAAEGAEEITNLFQKNMRVSER